jgi:hypothetical protein
MFACVPLCACAVYSCVCVWVMCVRVRHAGDSGTLTYSHTYDGSATHGVGYVLLANSSSVAECQFTFTLPAASGY